MRIATCGWDTYGLARRNVIDWYLQKRVSRVFALSRTIRICNFLRLSFTNKQKINFPLLNEMSARWRYFVYERTWEFAEYIHSALDNATGNTFRLKVKLMDLRML